MNVREVTKILFKIRSNLIDPKQKHAIWIAIKAIKYCSTRLQETITIYDSITIIWTVFICYLLCCWRS